MAYRTQGTPLNNQEVEHIQVPLLRFVKHKYGVPSSSPSAYWFSRKGGRMPRLQAEVDRRAVDMTVRMLSGKGCHEASTLAQRLEQRARQQLQFPGEMLAYPQLVADRNMPDGRQRMWWLYVAKILAARGVEIAVPTLARMGRGSIMAALKPGWAGGEEGRAYSQMWKRGVSSIEQVFQFDNNGALEMRPQRISRLFWERKIRTHLNILRGQDTGTPRQLGLQERNIRCALGEAPRRAHPMPFHRARIRQHWAGVDIAGRAAQAQRVVVHTDGSFTPATATQPASMGFAVEWEFHRATGSSERKMMSGAVRDGMFSSTTAELMALLVVATLAPADIEVLVKCDSQAAIAYMNQLQGERDYRWQKSPMAYLACWFVDAIRARTAPITLEWVRGHTGVAGNERADRAATAAQQQPQF
ncbi:hypothetical protein EV181_006393, partial [Coemansia sp. RSA 532]